MYRAVATPASAEILATADAVARELWDVLVVGAGPAGSMAAIHLASSGHRVLLVDRHEFPRDKACGDGLITDALNCLRRVGLYDAVRAAGLPVHEAAGFSPSRYEVRVRGDFVVLKRARLDDLLVREAVRRGAVLHREKVTALVVGEDRIVRADVFGSHHPIRARVALVATGADVSLLRRLGSVSRVEPSGFAVRKYVRSALRLDRLVVSFERSILPGYAWIFPVAEHEYNVGCGVFHDPNRKVDLRAMLDRVLEEFPLARALVDSGEDAGPTRGARLRCGLGGVRPVTDGRILAIGETVATTFPFTGEGIGKAMETGEIAASVLHDAFASGDMRALETYATRLERLRPRYAGYAAAERWLSQPYLNDLVMRRASKSAFLRQAFERIVNETVDPQEGFSVRGVLRSLIR